jgi:ArsR family metal-binding transcriptional regulator
VGGKKVLIESYEVVQVPGGCEDSGESVSIQANLPDDVSAVYPYVNALLPGAQYNHSGQVLRWREGSHVIVLRRNELAVSNLLNWFEAEAAIERLVKYLNSVWEHRDEIDSDKSAHLQATPIAVYKLLPNTNCRECGAQTCYAFALKLIAREASLDACPPMLEPEFARKRVELGRFFAPPPVVLFG